MFNVTSSSTNCRVWNWYIVFFVCIIVDVNSYIVRLHKLK